MSTITEQHRESLAKAAITSKRYYKSTLLATAILFLINGIILYFGTILQDFGYFGDVASFYGFKTQNDHLQRSSGILCFIIAAVNVGPLVLKHGDDMLIFSVFINLSIFLHYLLESVVFRGMRLEVVIVMFLFMILNCWWAYKDFKHKIVIDKLKLPHNKVA
jgi:hypothetical protein